MDAAEKKSTKRDLAEARRTLALAQVRHETTRLRAQERAYASQERWLNLSANFVGNRDTPDHLARLTEGVYDGFTPNYIDPATPYYDTPGFHEVGGMSGGLPTNVEDTLDGRYRPFWNNLADYRRLQGQTRWLAVGHPLGRNIIDTICDYVVHKGYAREVKPKDRKDKSAATAALAKEAQRILDEFHDRTGFKGVGECDVVAASVANGEKLLWIRHIGDGKAKLIDVPSEQLCELTTKDARDIEETYRLPASAWSFGVGSDLLDSSNVRAFFWNRDHKGTNYDVIDAKEAVWIKNGVPPQVKRGMTEFYPVMGAMKLWSPAFTNVIVQTAVLSSIAYVRSITSPSLGSEGSIRELGGTGPSSRMIRGAGGRYENIMASMYSPGEVHDTQGVEYKPGPMADGNAEAFIKVLDAYARLTGARWSIPEYLLSSIGSTTNRSTSETTEQGWLRRIDRTQSAFADHFYDVDIRVLDIACRAGLLKKWGVRTIEDLLERIALVLTPPPAKTKKRSEETTADKALVDAHAMSKQTFAERADVDWEEELDRLEDEKDNETLNPPPEPLGGFGGPPQAGGKGRPQPPQGKAKATRETTLQAALTEAVLDCGTLQEARNMCLAVMDGADGNP